MLNFRNSYNLRVLAGIVALVFFVNSTAYGVELSRKSHLRPHLLLNSQEGQDRAEAAAAMLSGKAFSLDEHEWFRKAVRTFFRGLDEVDEDIVDVLTQEEINRIDPERRLRTIRDLTVYRFSRQDLESALMALNAPAEVIDEIITNLVSHEGRYTPSEDGRPRTNLFIFKEDYNILSQLHRDFQDQWAHHVWAHFEYPTRSEKSIREEFPLDDVARFLIRNRQRATGYINPDQDFSGFDVDHYIGAQYLLRDMTVTQLDQLLIELGIAGQGTIEEKRRMIYKALAEQGYTKDIINLITAGAYDDPRVEDRDVTGQSDDPRVRAIVEAVANSCDALRASVDLGEVTPRGWADPRGEAWSMGKRGKGVKQMMEWLASDGDRIDVFSREPDGPALHHVILMDEQGQWYTEGVRKISLDEFYQARGQELAQGTVVRVNIKSPISLTEQEAIAREIHRCFSPTRGVNITTQIGNQLPQKVNDFEAKEVLVPFGAPSYGDIDTEGKDIHVAFTGNSITIIDNGCGMDEEILACMFVPRRTDKPSGRLTGDARNRELENLGVVLDRSRSLEVSFAAKELVIKTVSISEDIMDGAIIQEGITLECGHFLVVPESNKKINILLGLKPGQVSGFPFAIEHLITGLIDAASQVDLDDTLKYIKYINTIIVGIDGLIQGNDSAGHIVSGIRANVQNALRPIIKVLREEHGFVILPHNKQFGRLVIPEEKRDRVLYLHEGLFDWHGAGDLKEIGGEIVKGVSCGKGRLPLVVVPLTEETVRVVEEDDPEWHTRIEEERLPVVKTDRFIAISPLIGKRFIELARKRRFGLLNDREEEDFRSDLQRVSNDVGDIVVTSYEVTTPDRYLDFKLDVGPTRPTGELDEKARRAFLREPPDLTQLALATDQASPTHVPNDAEQRYVRLGNGDVVEVGTGKKVLGSVKELEYISNGYYKVKHKRDGSVGDSWSLVGLGEDVKVGNITNIDVESIDIEISPDKKWAIVQLKDIGDLIIVSDLLNLETGEFLKLRNFSGTLETAGYQNVQFSQDSRYMTYLLNRIDDQVVELVTVDLHKKEPVGKEEICSTMDINNIEYSINPFANVAYVRYEDTSRLKLLDLTTGKFVAEGRHLHTDSSGTYTVIVGEEDDGLSLYLHKQRRPVQTGRDIIGVVTASFEELDEIWIIMDGSVMARLNVEDGSLSSYVESSTGLERRYNYAESFLYDQCSFDFGETGSLSGEITTFNPLQRLSERLIYKHPHLNLIIDNSDPNNPEAWDPVPNPNGQFLRYKYKGEIVGYYRLSGDSDGELYFIDQDRVHRVINTGVAGSDLFHGTVGMHAELIDGIPVNYIAARDEENWKLINTQTGLPRYPDVSPEYTDVYFDGKYFIFCNPDRGDVVYLNPEPGKDTPIFVPRTVPEALDYARPEDAPNRYVIVGKGLLFDTQTKDRVRHAVPGERMERINNTTFLRHYKHEGVDKWEVIRFDVDIPTVHSEVLLYSDTEGKIITYTDTFIVTEKDGFQHIIDLDRGRREFLSGRKFKSVRISASGKFSVGKEKDDHIWYHNHHREDGTIGVRCIANPSEYKEYLVHDRADVVILKDEDDKYTLYSLEKGRAIIEKADHIEIDSSGTIAIAIKRGELSFHNLKVKGTVSFYMTKNGEEVIHVAHDEKYVYVNLLFPTGKERLFVYDRKNGTEKFDSGFGQAGLPPDLELPRFWESYDLEKKTIWDHKTAGQPFTTTPVPSGSGGLYVLNFPTGMREEVLMCGTTLLYSTYDEYSPIGKRTSVDLEEGSVKNLGEYEDLDFLRGGEVLFEFAQDKDKYIIILSKEKELRAFALSFTKAFVNESNTFILGQDENRFYLVDVDSNVTDITDQIPAGFTLTDVNGDHFVFDNGTQILHYNPEKQDQVIREPLSFEPARTAQAPSGAIQRYVLLENGQVKEAGTGRKVLEDVQELEVLRNGYYRCKLKEQSEVVAKFDGIRLKASTVVNHKKGERIITSPDKKWVLGQFSDGTLTWYTFDVDTEEYHRLIDFATSGEIIDSNFSHSQFSQDSRYLTYIEKLTDGKTYFVIADLQNLTTPTKIWFGKNVKVEYSINPFANVTFLKFSDGSLALIDLTTGKFVAEGKHLRTDSSGTYTVIIDMDDNVSIYLNGKGIVLTKENFDGYSIHGVVTKWKDDEVFFEAWINITGTGAEKTYGFDENGSVDISGFTADYDYYERFISLAKLKFDYHLGFRSFGYLDPLQRLQKRNIYKHQHFDLIIDNSDPGKPKAIDPETGVEFSYKGKIIYYDPVQEELCFCHEGEIAFVRHISDDEDEEEFFEGEPFEGIVDKIPADFSVVKVLDEYVFSRYTPDGHKAEGLDGILPKTYSQVSFDGKYFVFSNPETGDMVYLDPERPTERIFVPMKETRPATVLSDERPLGAKNRFVIVKNKDSTFSILDTETKEPEGPYERVQRVNDHTFIAYHAQTQWEIVCFDVSSPTTKRVSSFLPKHIRQDPIRFVTDRFIVAGEENRQYVVDLATRDYFPPAAETRSQAVNISFSGRFSVHKDLDGNIVYYDHDADEVRRRPLASDGTYTRHRVSDRADVVILEHRDKKYSVFSLEKECVLSEYLGHLEHVEIESSGIFAVVKHNGRLSILNLKNGDWQGYYADEIKTASDEKHTYVSFTGSLSGVSSGIHAYDRATGEFKGILGEVSVSEDELPRFWQGYNLEQDFIWDRVSDEERWWGTYYSVDSPVDPKYALDLFSDKFIGIEKSRNECQVVYLLPRLRREDMPLSDELQLRSLKGQDVWFTINRHDLIEEIVTPQEKIDPPEGTRANETNTFILIKAFKLNAFMLIDRHGNMTPIIDLIPPEFELVDVSGECFILINPKTGQIKYLNPRAVGSIEEGPVAQKAPDLEAQAKVIKALEAWKDAILVNREEWLNHARSAYDLFIDLLRPSDDRGEEASGGSLVPEEYKDEIMALFEERFKRLYDTQDREIREIYESSLAGNELDLDGLYFDLFARKMAQVMAEFPDYLERVQAQIRQQGVSFQRDFYTNLFTNLFDIAMDPELSVIEWNDEVFYSIGLGYLLTSQQEVDRLDTVVKFWTFLSSGLIPPTPLPTIAKIVGFISDAGKVDPDKSCRVVITQLERLFAVSSEAGLRSDQLMRRNSMLARLVAPFEDVEKDLLRKYLRDPEEFHAELGEASDLALFLTSEDGELVKEKPRFVPQGPDIDLPDGRVELSRIWALEIDRKKNGGDGGAGEIMSMDYLIGNRDKLPDSREDLIQEILRSIERHEPGAHAREIGQNTKDATQGMNGELEIEFYIQYNEEIRIREFVEEGRDNGTGALYEAALLILKSPKAMGMQIDISGFYGSGKYAIFQDVDRLEFITKNNDRAYFFSFSVDRDDSGRPTTIWLTGIRDVTGDKSLKRGVTVRRIKSIDSTIPQIDQMLQKRAWRYFIGFAQDKHFKAYFIDYYGNRQPLLTQDPEVLSEAEFIARRQRKGARPVRFGKARFTTAKGIPPQIICGSGLRVRGHERESLDAKNRQEGYFALVSPLLDRHIRELGITIQIPLPLIQSRDSFKHEKEYLSFIQRYVAILFYRAIAYKALTEDQARFVFENLSVDWNKEPEYWFEGDEGARLAGRINRGEYDKVTSKDLEQFLTEPGKLDLKKKLAKLIILLEVPTDPRYPDRVESLMTRRIAYLAQMDPIRAEAQRRELGIEAHKVRQAQELPYYHENLFALRRMVEQRELVREQQINDPTNVVKPSTPEEHRLIEMALNSTIRNRGITKVVLLKELAIPGIFIGDTKYLPVWLASYLGEPDLGKGYIDVGTYTLDHEDAHLLEHLAKTEKTRLDPDEWCATNLSAEDAVGLSHDARGLYAAALKHASGVALALVNKAVAPPEAIELSEINDRVVFFMEEEIRGNVACFKQAAAELATRGNIVVVIADSVEEFMGFCEANDLPQLGFYVRTPDDLALVGLDLEQAQIPIIGMEDLHCIPVSDEYSHASLQMARDALMKQ